MVARASVAAASIGLCLAIVAGCQPDRSRITLENRTTADAILATNGYEVAYLVPACGRVVFDPYGPRPTGADPSVSHPATPVIRYLIPLVPDAATIATVVITDQKVYMAVGPSPSLPACSGLPPIASALPT